MRFLLLQNFEIDLYIMSWPWLVYPFSSSVQEVSLFSCTHQQLCKICGQPCGFRKYPSCHEPIFPKWNHLYLCVLTCYFNSFLGKSKNVILKFIWLRNYGVICFTKCCIRVSGDCCYSWNSKDALELLLSNV